MVYPMTFTSLGDTPIPGEGNQAIFERMEKMGAFVMSGQSVALTLARI